MRRQPALIKQMNMSLIWRNQRCRLSRQQLRMLLMMALSLTLPGFHDSRKQNLNCMCYCSDVEDYKQAH